MPLAIFRSSTEGLIVNRLALYRPRFFTEQVNLTSRSTPIERLTSTLVKEGGDWTKWWEDDDGDDDDDGEDGNHDCFNYDGDDYW